jgi:GT2 family glycosyltransferase
MSDIRDVAPRGALSPGPGGATCGVLGELDLAVVILNYNTVDLLRECLRSVYASVPQVAPPPGPALRMQVCVVDNGSSDGSAAMVRAEYKAAHLIVNRTNLGYSAGNNRGLRWFGFGSDEPGTGALPRFVLLLNPDTVLPPMTLAAMVRFLEEHPQVGVAGPRVRRPDGSLDKACRRSFPTPQVSFYRMIGLSRLFRHSRRFNAYNLEYLAEDAVHPVDAVVGAFMLLRREAIEQAGLLDEAFFMYGEDLDWAKRIKDAGWQVWYNGQVEITHVKEAASRQSSKSRIDFYEAMWIFYRKHYRHETAWWLDRAIKLAIMVKGGVDVARHLWDYCRDDGAPPEPASPGTNTAGGQLLNRPGATRPAGSKAAQMAPDAGSHTALS